MRTNCIARLDYDSREALREGVRRMRFLLRYAAPHMTFRMRRYRTRHGWHVELFSPHVRLQRAEMVSLQAILGSDHRREWFNLLRVVAVRRGVVPMFWRQLRCWNVLHRKRLD